MTQIAVYDSESNSLIPGNFKIENRNIKTHFMKECFVKPPIMYKAIFYLTFPISLPMAGLMEWASTGNFNYLTFKEKKKEKINLKSLYPIGRNSEFKVNRKNIENNLENLLIKSWKTSNLNLNTPDIIEIGEKKKDICLERDFFNYVEYTIRGFSKHNYSLE